MVDRLVGRIVLIYVFQVEGTCIGISSPRSDREVQIRIIIGTANDWIMVFNCIPKC